MEVYKLNKINPFIHVSLDVSTFVQEKMHGSIKVRCVYLKASQSLSSHAPLFDQIVGKNIT